MKKTAVLSTLLVIFFLAGCGQKAPEPRYQPDSEQYVFFKTLSDSLGLTYLDPEKAVALIKTNDFTVWTFDIMPGLYARFKRFQSKPSSLPADQLRSTIKQGAQGEADKKLLANAAAQEGIAATDSAVNAQLEKYFQSRGGKEQFVEMVEQQGFTLEFVENDVRTQLGIQQYINNYLDTQLAVSEEELKAAYEADKTASVRHILFKTQGKTDEEKEQVKKNAQDVLARAKAGEDFAELATEFTDDPGSKEKGGLYENFPKGRMVPEFEEASFTLPIGAISDLVETAYGYHIIKIIDRQKETKPFEEVREQLENQLKQKNRRTAYDTLMDNLKDKANYTENFDVLG